MRTMRPGAWPTVALAAFIALTPRLHAQQVRKGSGVFPLACRLLRLHTPHDTERRPIRQFLTNR